MSETTDTPQEGTEQQITEAQFYQEMIGSQRPENARIFWYQDTGEEIRKENFQLLELLFSTLYSTAISLPWYIRATLENYSISVPFLLYSFQ